MSEKTENTFSAYLGPEFQQRLIWQLLVEPEFAEKKLPELAIEYFDDPNLKRLFIIMLEYFKEYDKVPNLQNQSIHQAISRYKTPNNIIEEESLFAVIKRIELWNERIINKQMLYDGDVVQKATNGFIKQQEYRKLSEEIQVKVKNGDIKSKFTIAAIEEKFQKISHIGEEEDDCEELIEGIDRALRKEFRETIPTGIEVIDVLTGGGLGKSEIGVILTPSGVGKTTALTIIANTAYEQEKYVAQVIFEDTKEQVKRKHYVIWGDSALSRLDEDEEHDRVLKIAKDKAKSLAGKGKVVIKRFSQEDTTIKDVRNWMLGYEKKYGIKFDILVLDYLDCLESHKKSPDRTESELAIIKGFESLAAELDIPAWTAIQSNRSGFGAEFVEAQQTGGSIKRIQKAHFFMSVAKTPAQQEANFANIRIIKARMAKDGQTFEDCVFNNDTMKIIIDDPKYRYSKTYQNLKHYDEKDVDNLENKLDTLNDKSSQARIHAAINTHTEGEIVEKINSDTINDMLRDNSAPEEIKPNTNFNPKPDDEQSEGAVEGVSEEILVLDGEITDAPSDAVNDAPSDAVNDGVTEGVSDGVTDEKLLDFSGDTTTILEMRDESLHIPFIPVLNTPTPDERKELDKGWEELRDSGLDKPFVSPPLKKKEYPVPESDVVVPRSQFTEPPQIQPPPIIKTSPPETVLMSEPTEYPFKEPLIPKMPEVLTSLSDIEKDLIEPDDLQGDDKGVYNMLIKKRDFQNVKPKE